jgi:hypothetical protein
MDLAVSALPRAPGAVPGKDPAVTGPDRARARKPRVAREH